MSQLRPFQIALLFGFFIIAIVAIGMVATFSGGGGKNIPAIVIWGHLPPGPFVDVLNQLGDIDKRYKKVTYRHIPAEEFITTLINALAESQSPDLIVLPHTELVTLRPKLRAIGYEAPNDRRSLRTNYTDGATIFALTDGLYAIPLAVDPLVLYWNRTLFSNANLAKPPTTWEQLRQIVPGLTKLDAETNNRSIIQSAIAFGETKNIRNLSPILSLLFLQSGSQGVVETEGRYELLINESVNGNAPPLETAVRIFTEFSNPSNPLYSWNRVQSNDRTSFNNGKLAQYIGFLSEISAISEGNPNLNFDVAEVPQPAVTDRKQGYGTLYGLAIPKLARYPNESYLVANHLASSGVAPALAKGLDMAPVRRDVLATGDEDIFISVGYRAALVSRAWLQPAPSQIRAIFSQLVEDVNSQKESIKQSADIAVGRLSSHYR